jgi:hypothetical protein
VATVDPALVTDAEVAGLLDSLESAAPGWRAELIRGQAISNRPGGLHTLTLTRLLVALEAVVGDGYQPVTDLRVRFNATTWVVPDIVVAREALLEANANFVTPADLLLVIEILSPSTASIDRGDKKQICHDAGELAIDVDRTLRCVVAGLWLVRHDGVPVVIGLVPGERHGPPTERQPRVEVFANSVEVAESALAHLDQLRRDHNVYRGKVLSCW